MSDNSFIDDEVGDFSDEYDEYEGTSDENDNLNPQKKVFKQLEENGYEKIKKIIEGGEGTIYIVKKKETNEEFIAKIPINIKTINNRFEQLKNKNDIENEKEEIRLLLHTLGGGFTKPIDKIDIKLDELGNTCKVEVYKKREIDLRDAMNNKQDIPLFAIMAQIAISLDKLHSRNITHRDLKPENIFLTAENVAKISDFGMSSTKEKNELAGSLFYMAPETLEKSIITKESDIYSFGLILLEIVSDKNIVELLEIFNNNIPIRTDNEFAAQLQICELKNSLDDKELKSKLSEIMESANLERLFPNINLEQNKEIRENIKEKFSELLEKTLQKNPENRPSAADLKKSCAKIADISKEIKDENGKNINLENNLKLRKKDLMDLDYLSEKAKECLDDLLESNDKNFKENLEKVENEEERKFLKKKFKNQKKFELVESINKIREEYPEIVKQLENYFYKKDLTEKAIKKFEKILNLKLNKKEKELKKACKNRDIDSVIILLNNKEKININKTSFFNKKTLLFDVLNKKEMTENDKEIAKLLIANDAKFGKEQLNTNIINNLNDLCKENIINIDKKNPNESLNLIKEKLKVEEVKKISSNLSEFIEDEFFKTEEKNKKINI